MHPDVAFDIQVSALLGRHRYTHDPGPVVEELRALGREGLVARTVGHWVGYYRDEHTGVLCDAVLVAFPAAREWVGEGEARRAVPRHGTTGF